MLGKPDVPVNDSKTHNYLVTLNLQEHITFCNLNFSNRFLEEHLPAAPISNLISSCDLHNFREDLSMAMQKPGTSVYRTLQFNRFNQVHHIKWEMVAEVRTGSDINIYLVGHDVTEPTIEPGTEQSLKILKSIFDSSDNVIFFISPGYQIRFFNKKAYDNGKLIHGKKMKIGDSILEFFKDVDSNSDKVFLEDFEKALEGELVTREAEIRYKADKIFWFRTEYYPVYENDRLIGVTINVSDITTRNQYEENIRVQNEKLRKIAFIQSHQVRQPLSNILGILSLLNTEGISEDDQYLVKILNLSAKQLDSVIRNIVSEAQQIELYNDYYNIKATIN